jgi:hypothetical protein
MATSRPPPPPLDTASSPSTNARRCIPADECARAKPPPLPLDDETAVRDGDDDDEDGSRDARR